MTDDEIRKIVSETVAATLIKLGLDADDPLELQADMLHLRRWRKSVENAGRQTLMTAVGIIVAGVIGLVLMKIGMGPR